MNKAQHADSRSLRGAALATALREARALVLARIEDLSAAQWSVPFQLGVNPVAWELAHLAWFGEFWILRGPHERRADGYVYARQPARIAAPDEHYDSARLAHALRWPTQMPERAQVLEMLGAQLEACIAALPADADDAALYFHRLTLFHEDMHGEAFAWMRAALEYAAPQGIDLPQLAGQRQLAVAAGRARIGWPESRQGFSFDNESAVHELELAAFEIDDTPISAGQFLEFVEAGGYEHSEYWPGEAGRWRATSALPHPARWRRDGSGWQVRWFDRWRALDPRQPVIHVNAWEAQAYCAWAGRRLPHAAEWEHAAVSMPAMRWGNMVWEWTADPFMPYAGFAPGPYHDYSMPWFHSHRELRGGSCATHARMHDPRYRNFFLPHRTDIFAGFRTVASGG